MTRELYNNIDLGKTKITDLVRVSSAAIYYDMGHYQYYQFETFIFSYDARIKTRQVIHGSCQHFNGTLADKTIKIHEYISNNLIELLNKHGYGRTRHDL